MINAKQDHRKHSLNTDKSCDSLLHLRLVGADIKHVIVDFVDGIVVRFELIFDVPDPVECLVEHIAVYADFGLKERSVFIGPPEYFLSLFVRDTTELLSGENIKVICSGKLLIEVCDFL